MTHAQEFALFSLVALWSAPSLTWGIYRRHRRRFRARRRGGYLRPTASSTTNRAGKSTGRAIRISVGSSNSRTAPGGQLAGLEILPLRPERSRSTGGGLNGTTSPLTEGQSTGDPGRPLAVVGFAEADGTTTATVIHDGPEGALAYAHHLSRLFPPRDWKPEYGETPAWVPSDELVSDNGRDWYPEPRDAA